MGTATSVASAIWRAVMPRLRYRVSYALRDDGDDDPVYRLPGFVLVRRVHAQDRMAGDVPADLRLVVLLDRRRDDHADVGRDRLRRLAVPALRRPRRTAHRVGPALEILHLQLLREEDLIPPVLAPEDHPLPDLHAAGVTAPDDELRR